MNILLDRALFTRNASKIFQPKRLFMGSDKCGARCQSCFHGFSDSALRMLHQFYNPVQAVSDLKSAARHGIKEINLSVGEPFYGRWEQTVLPVIAESADLQLINLDTNCSWATSLEAVIGRLSFIKNLGLFPGIFDYEPITIGGKKAFRFSISVDNEHQKFVPLNMVRHFIKGFYSVFPHGKLSITSSISRTDDQVINLISRLKEEGTIANLQSSRDDIDLFRVTSGGELMVYHKKTVISHTAQIFSSKGLNRANALTRNQIWSFSFPPGLVIAFGEKFFTSSRLGPYHPFPVGHNLSEAIETMNSNVVIRDIVTEGLGRVLEKAGLSDYTTGLAPCFNDVEIFLAYLLTNKSNEIRNAYLT